MPNIEAILREINRDLTPEFEKKLRASLADQDREWLIEQIVRLTLDAHRLEERDRRRFQEVETRKRQERVERVRKLALDVNRLEEFVREYRDIDRQRLVEQNLLSEDAPARGSGLITAEHRAVEGTRLLQHAKDMLDGFLFGDESTNTSLQRTQRQLLTLNLPRSKAQTLDFMKATTELSATGTWQDPGTDPPRRGPILSCSKSNMEKWRPSASARGFSQHYASSITSRSMKKFSTGEWRLSSSARWSHDHPWFNCRIDDLIP